MAGLFAAAVLGAAGCGAAGDGSAPATESAPALTAAELPDLGPVPELVDIDAWLNTDAASFAEARRKVTVVQFWTFGCSNCKATLPHLQELYASRHDDGLEIIGVHSPEFDYERDPDNIAEALVDLGVTWPVALDPVRTNFREWQGAGVLAPDLRNRLGQPHPLRSRIGEGGLRRAGGHGRRAAGLVRLFLEGRGGRPAVHASAAGLRRSGHAGRRSAVRSSRSPTPPGSW
ncbi:MAG: redoxin domain-containing protein [Acidimicrobiales bacterium]